MLNTRKNSLSELWRENRSKDPGTDLLSVLDGARIIAQTLDPELDVTFAGIETTNTDKRTIVLTAKLLGNQHPIPGEIVDILLGLTVHEVGHSLFSKDKREYLQNLAQKAGAYYNFSDYQSFCDLVSVYEDVYIDHQMSEYPGYRDYLKREREYVLGTFVPQAIIKPLENQCDRTDILNALIFLSFSGGIIPNNISPENYGILTKLTEQVRIMCTEKLNKDIAIINAWNAIKVLPRFNTPHEKFGTSESQERPFLLDTNKIEAIIVPEREESETDEANSEKTEEEMVPQFEQTTDPEIEALTPENLVQKLDGLINDKTQLESDLAKDVKEAIVEKRADLTQLLPYLAKDSQSAIITYTPPDDPQRAAAARSRTPDVEEKLRRIFQDYRLKRTRDYRGLTAGRVSTRRLHRVAYGDQRVFQRRERPDEIDAAICLLMDLSDSMMPMHDLIDQIICGICDAFQKEKMEFIALGYSISGDQNVYIPRLYDKEIGRINLRLEKEWGKTPSYEGLAAAEAQLLRLTNKKQRILFHFTDGRPTAGASQRIPDLLKDMKARGIADIHICLTRQGETGNIFKHWYGKDTFFINDIIKLPEVIDMELRRRL